MAAFDNYQSFGGIQTMSPQAQLAQLTSQIASLQNSFAASQPIVQPVVGPPVGDSITKLNGMDGVNQYLRLMKPNSRAVGFDANDDIFYVMQTDSSNYPAVRKFRFTEIIDAEPAQPQYVTIEEFNKFKEDILNAKQSVWPPGATGSDQSVSGDYFSTGGSKTNNGFSQNNAEPSGRSSIIA